MSIILNVLRTNRQNWTTIVNEFAIVNLRQSFWLIHSWSWIWICNVSKSVNKDPAKRKEEFVFSSDKFLVCFPSNHTGSRCGRSFYDFTSCKCQQGEEFILGQCRKPVLVSKLFSLSLILWTNEIEWLSQQTY